MTTGSNIKPTYPNFQLEYDKNQHTDDGCSENQSRYAEALHPLNRKAGFNSIEKCLTKKSLLHLKGDHSGEKLTCIKGIIWVTQSGNPDDIYLCAGESFDIPRKGDILIQGMADARLKLTAVPAKMDGVPAFRDRIRHLFNRFM